MQDLEVAGAVRPAPRDVDGGTRRGGQSLVLALVTTLLLTCLAVGLALAQTEPPSEPRTGDAPASDLRYASMTDAAAWRLAQSVLPPDPHAVPLGAAPVAARGAAAAKTAKTAKQAVDYLNDHEALVAPASGKGPRQLVASTAPLRARDGDGNLRPLDLRLKPRGRAYLAPANAGTDVLLARSLSRSSLLRDVGLRVRPIMPRSPRVTARQAATAFYPNADASTDVTLSAEPGGLQAMWVLRSKLSPETVGLRLGAPKLKLKLRRNGEVLVRGRGKQPLAIVRAPVAWDRKGKPVAVRTTIDGSTLRYTVDHRRPDTAYPVVLDPLAETYTWLTSSNYGGWDAVPNASGSTTSFVAATGLAVTYGGGPRTTPGKGEWVYKAQGASAITSFVAGNVTLTSSTPAGTNCAYVGLRRSDGVSIAQNSDTTKCSTPITGATYLSPVTNPANVAFMRQEPTSTATSGTATLTSATLTIDENTSDVPADGPTITAPTLASTTQRTRALPWVGLETERLNTPLSDAGIGVKTVDLKDPAGTVIATKTPTPACSGIRVKCPPTWTAPIDFSIGRPPQGTPRTYTLVAADALGFTTTQDLTLRHDRTLPDIQFSGTLADNQIGNTTKRLTITGRDGSTAETDQAYQQSGVRSIQVKLDGTPQGTDATNASCAHGCSLTRDFDLALGSLSHGNHTIDVVVTDFAGNVDTKRLLVVADLEGPFVALGGTAYDARGTTVDKESYSLHVEARDGTAGSSPESGVEDIEILWYDNATATWRQLDYVYRQCDTDSCALELDYTFEPRRFTGPGRLTAKVKDKLGHITQKFVDLTPSTSSTYDTTALSGLEEYLQFDSTATGAGSRAHVNQTTGNLVWNHLPIVNPGRGLSTFVNVSYNSQTGTGGYDELGPGFSAGISGPTRINEPLDVTQATATTDARITLVDADGTRHVFRRNPSGLYYDAPPGVQLHLRSYSSAFDKTWAMTRPDGVTHFFDQRGYLTWIEDRNSNVLRFDYEIVPLTTGASCPTWGFHTAAFSATDCKQRLVAVTDSAGVRGVAPGRSVRLTYTSPRGRIATITDHAGRVLSFTYSGNRLTELAQAAGSPDERTFRFFYGAEGLGAIQDPRGAHTRFAYTSGHRARLAGPNPPSDVLSDIRVAQVTQRDRRTRAFTYDKASAGSEAQWSTKASNARSQTTTYETDHRGRTLKLTDPRGTDTRLRWDGDNNVTKVTEAAGTTDEAVTDMGYDANGLLRWISDPEYNRTNLGYQVGVGTHATDNEGRNDFVADLNRVETPKGVATGAPDDFTEIFEVDPRGNVTGRRDAAGHWARTDFDPFGRVVKETDTMGNETHYEQHDPNGLPRVVVDPKGGRSEYAYDAVGNLLATSDPRAERFGGLRDPAGHFQSRFTYNAQDQLVAEVLPKDSSQAPAVATIRRGYEYDPNGNTLRQVDGTGAATTSTFDEMDRPTTVKTPPVTHAGEDQPSSEIARVDYDGEGLVLREQTPRGAENASSDVDFSTDFEYDANGQLVVKRRHQLDNGQRTTLVTSMGYDRRGNLTALADPRKNAQSADPPLKNIADGDVRWTFEYDKADRKTRQYEGGTLGLTTQFFHDRNDNVVKVVDPRWYDEVRTYDERDLLVHVRDQEWHETRYERRADGLVRNVRLPNHFPAGRGENEHTERFVYDELGSVVEHHLPRTDATDDPKRIVWRYDRDAVGNAVRVTDPRGNAFENTFLDSGALKTTERPSAFKVEGATIVERHWSEMGNEASTADLPSSEGEGDFGSVDAAQEPDLLPKAGQIEATYDDELRLASVIERTPGAADATATLKHDALGRMIEMRRPIDTAAGRFITDQLAYDRNGNLAASSRTNAKGEDWTSRRTYDGFDRLVAETAPAGSDGTPDVSRYTLDPNGNPTAIQSPRGDTVVEHRCYDAVDRLVSVTDPERQFSTMDHDENGNVIQTTRPEGFALDPDPADCDDQPAQVAGGIAKWSTEFHYNGRGQLEWSKEGGQASRLTTLQRDAAGNVTRVEQPGAASTIGGAETRRVTTAKFNGRNLPYRVTETGTDRARSTITEYDAMGNLRRTVNPAGIDADGTPSFTDEAPQQTSIDSSDDQNDDSVKRATDDATLYEYSPDGLLTARHLPHDNDKRYRQTFHHDARGRTTAIDAPNEWTTGPSLCDDKSLDPAYNDIEKAGCVQRTSYSHLDSGWIKESKEPLGARPNPETGANQPAIVPVGGEKHRYDYDERGLQRSWQVVNRSNAVRRTMTRDYWANGALRTRLADRAGDRKAEDKPREYDYRWSDSGKLTSIVDRGADVSPLNGGDDRVYRMAYDKADRLVATDEDLFKGREGQDTLIAYDRNGNVVERRHNGKLDQPISGGNLVSSAYTGGTTTHFDLDEFDREVRSLVDPANDLKSQVFETAYFSSDERSTREEFTVTESSEAAAKPARPAPGQALRVRERFSYGTDGRQLSMTRRRAGGLTDDKSQTYEYDVNGSRTKDETGTYLFNAREQLRKWTRNGATPNANGNVEYTVNGAGDILRKVDSNGTTKTITNRMALGRLLETIGVTGGTTPVTTKLRYGYDTAASNVATINEVPQTGGTDGTPKPIAAYAYDPFDRITEQQVLRAGQSTPDTGETDDDDRDVQTFTYDGFDRRDTEEEFQDRPTGTSDSRKTADYGYIGTSPAVSRRGALHRSQNKTSSFDYDSGLDSLGVSRTTNGTSTPDPYRSFAKDANGSVEGLTGDTGALASQLRYDPYGSAVDANGLEADTLESSLPAEAQDQPLRFQGFYLDSGVKTYDMQARSYLPSAGRFLTQDRFESASGDFNLVSDPLTQNRYAFAGGNPISNVEFDGHEPATSHNRNARQPMKNKRGGCIRECTKNGKMKPRPKGPPKSNPGPDPYYQRGGDPDEVEDEDFGGAKNGVNYSDAKSRGNAARRPLKYACQACDSPATTARKQREARKGGNLIDLAGGFSCEFSAGAACFGDKETLLYQGGKWTAVANPKGVAQAGARRLGREGFEEIREQSVRHRKGREVPKEQGMDWALMDPMQKAHRVVEKYGINLRGSGQQFSLRFDPDLQIGTSGRVVSDRPDVIEFGPYALQNEEELARTIAHEVRHARAYLGSGENTEDAADASEEALRDYIRGKR